MRPFRAAHLHQRSTAAPMKCPGQDSRCWKGDPVAELPCPECGSAVEIFKDERTGRCHRCGHRFLNPGADFGCAQWCSVAKECVGFTPNRQSRQDPMQGALAARLIQWIEQQCKGDTARINYALRLFQHAKELIRKEGGDPRVVLSASLLLAAAARATDRDHRRTPESASPPEGMEVAEEALEHLGLDADAREQVRRIVHSCRCGEAPDTVEFRVVSDSETLARLATERFVGGREDWENEIVSNLRTEAGKERARSLFPA